MPKVRSSEMADYTPEQPLVKGWYDARIVDAKTDTFNGIEKLLVNLLLQGGPDQPDSEQVIENRQISDFIQLEGLGTMKDKGRFLKKKFYGLAEAAGMEISDNGDFDPDELIESVVEVHLVQNTNPNSGEVENRIDRYRRA